MRKKPRIYTEEYKKQAMQLAQDLGSRTAAARQLGISDVNIYNWENNEKSTTKALVSVERADESEELKRLRKETLGQKKVIQILKSAAAFFSQDQLK